LTIEFQDFKKSLRGPDSARSGRSGNLFRASNSLGSLGALFSSNPKKRRGIPPHLSKSEETLDSMKQSISDTEDSVSDTVNVSENQSDTEEHSSPVRARSLENNPNWFIYDYLLINLLTKAPFTLFDN
jgi:hypothetical protein